MTKNDFMDMYKRYGQVYAWLQTLSELKPILFDNLMEQAQKHMAETAGCSPSKFKEIKSGFDTLTYLPEDEKLFRHYHDYLDGIRKDLQQDRK